MSKLKKVRIAEIASVGFGAAWMVITLYQSTIWLLTSNFPPMAFNGVNLPLTFLGLFILATIVRIITDRR